MFVTFLSVTKGAKGLNAKVLIDFLNGPLMHRNTRLISKIFANHLSIFENSVDNSSVIR